MAFEFAAAFFVSYLIGSVSFAYLAGRAQGVDLSKLGSGTLGARNVKRILGKRASVAVLLLDLFKGAGAVYIAMALFPHKLAPMAGWLGVVCGHGWSLFLDFKGGKGLASSAGALAVISPAVLLTEILIGAGFLVLTRHVYLSSIVMAASLPIAMLAVTGDPAPCLSSVPIAVAILLLHRKNIAGLKS